MLPLWLAVRGLGESGVREESRVSGAEGEEGGGGIFQGRHVAAAAGAVTTEGEWNGGHVISVLEGLPCGGERSGAEELLWSLAVTARRGRLG